MKKLLAKWIRGRFLSRAEDTRRMLQLPDMPLDKLRREIEATCGWAHASFPTISDCWTRFWLWAWVRRKIKKSSPKPPNMRQLGLGHWAEIPVPIKNLPSLPESDYWKTHEPIILSEDCKTDLVSGEPHEGHPR